MPVTFRKRFRFGKHYFATASRSGVSHTIRFRPVSWNSRTGKISVDLPGPFGYKSRGRYGFGGFLLRALLPMLTLVLAGLGWAWSALGGDPVGVLSSLAQSAVRLVGGS
jgi:hypothetical protein